MRQGSIRKLGSALLLSAVWLSATALPVSVFAQTNATAQNKQDDSDSKKDSKKENKKDKKQTDNKSNTTQAQNQTQTKSGLSPNEDPSMIGKRNINGGTDKFFGWLGGSKEKEAAIGRQMAMEVEQQAKMVDDPIITEYINRVGQNLVQHSDAKVPFTIKVIQDDSVNAFALPGGYFFVNTGLILAADNEAELAGAMAHEIGHVAARHAMENQGKATALNYGMLAGIIFGGGIASTVLQNAGGFGQMLAFFKFSRGAEEEADRLGVQYLYASGYDPTAMSTMFEKIESLNKKKPSSFSKLFATHPQPVDRRNASLSLVSKFPEHEEYVMSTSEFQKVKARLLRFTNAKASTTYDIDDPSGSGNGKPTLKRRDPAATDDTTTTTPASDQVPGKDPTKEAPPQLKRRGADPQATPTPQP